MKQKIISILVILAGFFLLSYPFVSNYLFEKSAGSTVESYQEKAAGMDQSTVLKIASIPHRRVLFRSIVAYKWIRQQKKAGQNNQNRYDLLFHFIFVIGHLAASSFPIDRKSVV